MSQYIRQLGETVRELVGRCAARPPAARPPAARPSVGANSSAAQRCFSSEDDCQGSKSPPKQQGECSTGKEDTCEFKDANRHKRAKPDPCPPRHLNPAIPPWCTLPHLKDFGKKKEAKVDKGPCDEGEEKCPADEGIAYRRSKRAEERNFKETMQKRIDADKKLDEEWKKAKDSIKKPPIKDTFSCGKDSEWPPKCGH